MIDITFWDEPSGFFCTTCVRVSIFKIKKLDINPSQNFYQPHNIYRQEEPHKF